MATSGRIPCPTGRRKFLTRYDALLVAPQRTSRNPVSKLASRGQQAEDCEVCGWWHRIPATEVDAVTRG